MPDLDMEIPQSRGKSRNLTGTGGDSVLIAQNQNIDVRLRMQFAASIATHCKESKPRVIQLGFRP